MRVGSVADLARPDGLKGAASQLPLRSCARVAVFTDSSCFGLHPSAVVRGEGAGLASRVRAMLAVTR